MSGAHDAGHGDRRRLSGVCCGARRGRPASVRLDSDHVFRQPGSRGTGLALYVALAMIRRWNPSAVVTVTPTDHHVEPNARYLPMCSNGSNKVSSRSRSTASRGAIAGSPRRRGRARAAPFSSFDAGAEHGAMRRGAIDDVDLQVRRARSRRLLDQCRLRTGRWS